MELSGSISKNLTLAVQSARRLRRHPVHADTLAYWEDLLSHARREVAGGSTEQIQALIAELESELADRVT